MPGSNWHTYLYDPDGQSNELYYGIEQIGWNGHSKPKAMYDRGFDKPPELPQISEFEEVQQARAKGIDIFSGYRHVEKLPAQYNVDGVLLPRPFKIVRLGPVYLFTENMEAAETFYRDTLGFIPTEEVIWRGERCLFLRCNTEHHSVALLPLQVRDALGLSAHSKCAALWHPTRQLPPAQRSRQIFPRQRRQSNGIDPGGTSPRNRILRHGA